MGDDNVEEYDLRGLRCPLPVLKTRNRMRKLQPGEQIWVVTDDPLAALDLPNYCNEYDQLLVEQRPGEGDEMRFLIARRGNL